MVSWLIFESCFCGTQRAVQERRIDPDDGYSYTWDELAESCNNKGLGARKIA